MRVSLERIDEILAYVNENGESEALQHFGINAETIRRYERRKRFFETKQPKVLLIDIETTPLQAHTWHTGKQRIGYQQIINEWFMLSYAVKWLFDSKVKGSVLTSEEALHKDDSRISRELWHYFDQADVIIGHNISGFDLPKAQTRFLLNKLAPPSPFRVIDTLTVARQNFRFSSNKLDYIGELLLNDRKIHTEYELWLRCLAGDQKSLQEMLTYNKKDVLLLEEAYVFLRPYIKGHPNMGIYQEAIEPTCPTCGSVDIDECGHYTTSVNRYLAFRCKDCGAICRSRKNDTPLKCKSGIMMPTSR
jgi:DNA polymerase III epsilon subunit-like protein